MVRHFFTVDVEEYFQVSAFSPWVPRGVWETQESRVERGVEVLLELLDHHSARGTFFVLGWLAERKPHMIRRIAAEGHEIASHGWGHRRVPELTPETFRSSVRRAKRALEDVTGLPVRGYRAPSFSIVPGKEWALDILIEEGYRYDSSLYPIRRPDYGYPAAPRDVHWRCRKSGTLLELPPATWNALGARIPAGGGGYLRLFPLQLIRSAIWQAQSRGVPATLYVHPWELDPEQPRLDVPWTTRVRHYGGLGRTRGRLDQLLREFRFQPVEAFLSAVAPLHPQQDSAGRRPPVPGIEGGAAPA